MATKISRADVRGRLSKTGVPSGTILFDEKPIGRFVTYGKGGSRGNIGARTAYGSRIYRGATSIEVEAGSTRVMLDKVAAELSRAIKAGLWPADHQGDVSSNAGRAAGNQIGKIWNPT